MKSRILTGLVGAISLSACVGGATDGANVVTPPAVEPQAKGTVYVTYSDRSQVGEWQGDGVRGYVIAGDMASLVAAINSGEFVASAPVLETYEDLIIGDLDTGTLITTTPALVGSTPTGNCLLYTSDAADD